MIIPVAMLNSFFNRYEGMVFTDSGAAFLSGYQSAGISSKGLVFIMRKT